MSGGLVIRTTSLSGELEPVSGRITSIILGFFTFTGIPPFMGFYAKVGVILNSLPIIR